MNIELRYGALSPPLMEQLKKQGVKADPSLIKPLQEDADAITRLSLRHLLTEKQTHQARQKLTHKILKGPR